MSRFSDWNIDCKVYIGSLGSRATKEDIEDAFSRYGPLRNVWIARNPPGFGFVEFEDRRDAEEAVKELDGSRLCGSRIRVEMSHGKTRRDRDRRREPRRNASPPPYRKKRYSRSRSRSRSPPKYNPRGRKDRSYSRDRR